MTVTIREKILKDNRTSLYLDIYVNRKRSYRTLELYIFTKPKNQFEKDQNKEIKNKAELIRVRTLNQFFDNKYQIHDAGKSTYKVLDYFKYLTEKKKKSKTYKIWYSAVLILEEFLNGETRFLRDLTITDVENIKNYFLSTYVKKNNKRLSPNSVSTYFSKIKAGLNQAYRDKLINTKLADNIKSIPKKNTPRQYLTVDELIKLKNTDCNSQLLKTAFLFSALTGLRWSDVSALKWSNLNHSSDRGHYILFRQQKTGSDEWLSINEQAVGLLGERKDDDQKVFKGLIYSHFNAILSNWMKKANIPKHITFHCARHSYATMLVGKDVNISTISKMLGHKDIRTTQIYAQVVDKAKVDAAKLLNIF